MRQTGNGRALVIAILPVPAEKLITAKKFDMIKDIDGARETLTLVRIIDLWFVESWDSKLHMDMILTYQKGDDTRNDREGRYGFGRTRGTDILNLTAVAQPAKFHALSDYAGQFCFQVAYMASLSDYCLCLGHVEMVFGPGDISWTLGAALIEGKFLCQIKLPMPSRRDYAPGSSLPSYTPVRRRSN
ncbi:hypothetical protein V8G54_013657 [Vigna mungo]|uniref:Uncharacterized protein n=1 Tax=Vigna mungo TaxID=3915 RepID=A0AAQ3NI48_VIGMU